ncbi:MAG: hypothetical protein AB1938_04415 [Myxococcota bacterium]
MRLIAFTLLALGSGSALADEVFHAREPAHVSVERVSLTREEDAELTVTSRVLKAPYGVRREAGREQFSSSVGLALGEVYVVRDWRTAEHRVRVTVLSEGFVRVELLNARHTLGLRPPARFVNATVTLNGQPSEARFGELVLGLDGAYRMGQARGRWVITDDAVRLEGPMAHWGAARSFDAGHTLTFSFRRGPVEWVLRYERVSEDAVAVR